MGVAHPLIALPMRDVFKRRPRLTNQEAIVLNTIVNGNGEPVTIDDLVNSVYRGQKKYASYHASIRRVVSYLRAKLGEEAYNPTQIQTVYVERKGRSVLAYRYVEG